MDFDIENLQRRSELLSAVRLFFLEREFVEVETPLLSREVIPETHIEPIPVSRVLRGNTASPDSSRIATQHTEQQNSEFWLQASPELHMKRLVAGGMPAIFQITRSFRDGEQGDLHNPEFTIVEWYRVGDDMQTGMDLLDQLLQETLQALPAKQTSYAEAFQDICNLNPHKATLAELAALAEEPPAGMRTDDRDEWLNFLLATRVEPELGRDAPEILYHYPASQAALAKLTTDSSGQPVAQRFELYWHGVELANGYDELTDAEELRNRLETVNASRKSDGRGPLPIPESLLMALTGGLPDCTGCALGLDRLAMLACGAKTLSDVVPFRLT